MSWFLVITKIIIFPKHKINGDDDEMNRTRTTELEQN